MIFFLSFLFVWASALPLLCKSIQPISCINRPMNTVSNAKESTLLIQQSGVLKENYYFHHARLYYICILPRIFEKVSFTEIFELDC